MNENIPEFPENNNPANGRYPLMSPVAAAVTGIVLILVLYQFIGGLLTLLIFGVDISSANVNALRLMTVAGQLLFILTPTIMLAKYIYSDVDTILRIKLPNFTEIAIFFIGLIILIPLLQYFLFFQELLIRYIADNVEIIGKLYELFEELSRQMEQSLSNLFTADSIFEISFVVVVAAVVPAVCEEFFFRGYVQRSLELKISPFWAILITSIIFGLFHFNPVMLPALIILGFYIGFAAYKSGSLVIPVFLHFFNNFFSLIVFFIFGDEELLEAADQSVSAGDEIFPFFLLLLVFAGFIYWVNKNYSRLKTTK